MLVIEAVRGETDPRRRIDTLIQVGLALPHGAEAAIRVWSSIDPHVHAVQDDGGPATIRHHVRVGVQILQNERQAQVFAAWAMYLLVGYEQALLPPDHDRRWSGSSDSCATRSTPAGSPRCPTVTDAARDEPTMSPVEVEHVQHVLAMLRERLYGAISCLATLAVLARYSDEDTSAWVADDRRRGHHGRPVGRQPACALRRTHGRVRARAAGAELDRQMVQASGQILQAACCR